MHAVVSFRTWNSKTFSSASMAGLNSQRGTSISGPQVGHRRYCQEHQDHAHADSPFALLLAPEPRKQARLNSRRIARRVAEVTSGNKPSLWTNVRP